MNANRVEHFNGVKANDNYQRQTKIVATLGPASWSEDGIGALKKEGANVFRINCSHLDLENAPEQLPELVKRIRDVCGKSVEIMVDLQGPKLRIGRFASGDGQEKGVVILESGQEFTFDSSSALGDLKRVHLPHPEIFERLNEGDDIFLNDGQVHVRVASKDEGQLKCDVIHGGELSDRKGFNVKVDLPYKSLTGEDRGWVQIINDRNLDINYVAQSFVETTSDVQDLSDILEDPNITIIPKIERPKALDNFYEIVMHPRVFKVMVARGDLGIETDMNQLPMEQEDIIGLSNDIGKDVIVATHMMESMINGSLPTRAELKDVSSAVKEGAWGVMLSGETAVGKHPSLVVNRVANIARSREMHMKGLFKSNARQSFERAVREPAFVAGLQHNAK